MDSGINKNHQDLKGKIVKDYNAINPGNENVDNYGHGTAVAGIIAAHDDDLGLTGISLMQRFMTLKFSMTKV